MKHSLSLNSTAILLTGVLALAALEGCKKDATGQNTAAAGAAVTRATAAPTASQANTGPQTAQLPAAAAAPCLSAGGKVAVGVAPPPRLPVEHQPPIPGPGYVWTPGNWAWNGAVNDYYWTPGLWVQPPGVGLLWTPGYWGWNNSVYLFNVGYWGPTVGFYGGINYGFGYGGFGYDGGYWRGNSFYYNRSVNNLGGARINTIYDGRVSVNRSAGRASFNGGRGGVRAQPNAGELAASRQAHSGPSASQESHALSAGLDPSMRAGVNHGHPTAYTAGGRSGSGHGRSAATYGAAHTASSRSTSEHGYGGQAAGRAQVHGYGGSSQGGYRGETAHAASSFHSAPSGGGSQTRSPSGGGQRAPSGGGHAPGGGGENHPGAR